MAFLAPAPPADKATSPDRSHTIMVRHSYQRDDWRRLQLNDAVEDALSKILRFGFDIDRVEAKPATAQSLRDQILAWAKHIAGEIPDNWQEIYDFTFEALFTPHAAAGAAFILTPETAGADYRHKLQRLSEAELDQLFDNIAAYPRTAGIAEKLDAVVNQAVEATRDWQTCAVANHRPIYTGTSGHMLSYSRLFLSNVAPEGCSKADHPTLEQLRVTMLAALIGFNQHHTYDECMVAFHALTCSGVTLKYTDRVGYRDITDSTDSFVRNKVGKPLLQAMVQIGKQFVANFEEHEAALVPPLPNPRPLVAQWFKDTTGRDFSMMN